MRILVVEDDPGIAFGFPVHFRPSGRSSGIRSNHDPKHGGAQ
jgi:hypothetical protein